jgi:hypothetical protein
MVSDRKTDPPRSSRPSERLPLANQWTTIGEALTRATRTVGLTVLTPSLQPFADRPGAGRGEPSDDEAGTMWIGARWSARSSADRPFPCAAACRGSSGQTIGKPRCGTVALTVTTTNGEPHPHWPCWVRYGDYQRDDVGERPTDHDFFGAGTSRRITPVDRLACDCGGRYLPEMVRKPDSRQRSTSNARPFFELIEQKETLLTTIELDWQDEVRADAKRRLARIARALRHAPETSERLLDVS